MTISFPHLLENRYLEISLGAWLVAQSLKVLGVLLRERRFDLRPLVSAGGMPSSHSALVCALATCVGVYDGWSSSAFAIAAVFAAVVMYDAAGVRWAASRQAMILNRMLREFFSGHPISQEELKELIGHTPVQVFAGAALGVGWALFWTGGWGGQLVGWIWRLLAG